jgi:hypothetical protein
MFYRTSELANQMGSQLLEDVQQQLALSGVDRQDMALTLLLHPSPLTADLAVTPPLGFSYNGDKPFYPASVVKSFYLVAIEAALQEGRVQMHDELERAMRDMILWSSNNATNYIIDLISGTTGDTLLEDKAFKDWQSQRNVANRYFKSLGWPEFEGINVCQKLMDDDRYGRERQFATLGGNNHNRLTTDATARLLFQLFSCTLGNLQCCDRMRQRFLRPLDEAFVIQEAAQVQGFLGGGLPSTATLYSKAGWNGSTGDPLSSYNRHDAAYIELEANPDGLFKAFTLILFSHGRTVSTDEKVFPSIGRKAYALIESVR